MPTKKLLNAKVVAIPDVGEGGGGAEVSSTPEERTAEPGLEGGEEAAPEVPVHEGDTGVVVTSKRPPPGEGAPAPQGTGGKTGTGVQHRKRIERPDES